jgi:hypothetical protein
MPALHFDLATVILDDAIDEGEAETAALGFGRVERLEDVGEIRLIDSVARVGDPDLQLVRIAGQTASADANLTA